MVDINKDTESLNPSESIRKYIAAIKEAEDKEFLLKHEYNLQNLVIEWDNLGDRFRDAAPADIDTITDFIHSSRDTIDTLVADVRLLRDALVDLGRKYNKELRNNA